jgi:hypothetical protein
MGCPAPLIFLFVPSRQLLLFCCPFCDGIWDKSLFANDVKDPRVYDPNKFHNQEVVVPRLDVIQSVWNGEVQMPSNSNEDFYNQQYYSKILCSILGDKLDKSSL